ncbi:RNA polymerase sigma factor [Nannocystaceae bacterium ST9]
MSSRPQLRLVADDEPSECSAQADFAEAFRRHYRLVHRMLREYGVDEASLDDAAQDVFLVVHRRWHDYDGRAAFSKWLIGIVRRVAKDYRRSARRTQARLDKVVPPGSPADPEHRMAEREEVALVERFLDRLDVERREVLVLADIEGMTAPEISSVLGVNLNTVYSRLRTARQRFDAFLARHRAPRDRGHARAR